MAGETSVGGKLNFRSATPTIDTSAYADGDLVGTLMTFDNVAAAAGYGGVIQSVKVMDGAGQALNLDLILFRERPTTDISSMDNAAYAPSDADLLKALTHMPVDSWTDFSANSLGRYDGPAIPFVSDSSNQLFGLLVSRGAPTYGVATDLVVEICVLRD